MISIAKKTGPDKCYQGWLFHFVIFLFIPLTACGQAQEPVVEIPPVATQPVLVSSTPSQNEQGITDGNFSIVLAFDQEVTLSASPAITLNGKKLNSIVLDKKTVTLAVTLEKSTDYELIVPKGTVKSKTNLDSEIIQIAFRTKESVHFSGTLVTPDPSKEAQNLFRFLSESYGNRAISSTVANVNWNTKEAQWVYKQTGKYPAMNCFDFIHSVFSPSDWINYNDTKVVEEWWDNNGLVACMWHWNILTNDGTDYTFRPGNDPKQTNFDVARISDPQSEEYRSVIKDIDQIAGYLKQLKDKNIPVIWRPMHEAAGNTHAFPGGTAWFWWGASGAEPYKALWRLMFDRMVNHHALNNLVWVWTTQNNDPDWYPGDSFVDIVGIDLYNIKSASDAQGEFSKMAAAYGSKMAALSECGGVPKITGQWGAGAKWSWFMPWYDHDRTVDPNSAAFSETSHQFCDAAWWTDAVNSQWVITRDKMPDLK